MKTKQALGVAVVIVVVIGFFAYPYVRLLQFKMDADKFMRDDLGRFATADHIIGVDKRITALAQKHGFKSATSSKKITMRSTAGTADMFYVLHLEVTVDGHEVSLSQRIDGIEDDLGKLMEAGVTIPGNH